MNKSILNPGLLYLPKLYPRGICQSAGDRAARVIQLMSLRSILGRFEVAILSDTNRRDLIKELGSYLEAAES